jgi:hypothetical protein
MASSYDWMLLNSAGARHSLALVTFGHLQISPTWFLGISFPASLDAADTGRSKPTHKQQYDEDDQDDTDDTDATVTETVTVAAEAATEATKQEDDKDNDEYKSERHDLTPLVEPNE